MKKQNDIERVLYICVIIIIISLIINIVFSESKKLDEPEFFNHHYDLKLYNQGCIDISIYYLANSNDERKVSFLLFPESGETLRFIKKYVNKIPYKYYDLVVLHMEGYIPEEYLSQGELILENPVIVFNNGDEMKVDIGEFLITKYENENEFAENILTSSSNTNNTKDIYKVSEPIVIKSITAGSLEETAQMIDIGIKADDPDDMDPSHFEYEEFAVNSTEGVEFYELDKLKLPITVNTGFKVYTRFEMNDEKKKFDFYRVIISINFENSEGKVEVLNIRYTPELSEKMIMEFLESRGR